MFGIVWIGFPSSVTHLVNTPHLNMKEIRCLIMHKEKDASTAFLVFIIGGWGHGKRLLKIERETN